MENVKGYVDRIMYQSEETGYTVIRLLTEGKELVCVGNCLGISQGENIEAFGDYEMHPSYGKQFHVSEYSVVLPTDASGMERYLASGAIKGVGEKMAAKIVKEFGSDTFRIIEEEPEKLAQIKGISLRIAREIAEQMEEKKDLREAMTFLAGYGISNHLAVKIYDKYQVGIYHVLKENPYQLAEDVHGVGFRIADEIAARVGISMDSDYRIRCGISYVLQQATLEGHVYLPMERLLERSVELLGVDKEAIRLQIDHLVMDRKLVAKGDCVFPHAYYYAELSCAKMLHELNVPLEQDLKLPSREAALTARLEKLAKREGIELDELQMNAVRECICNGLFILTGGPGTGKTTTINMIIRYFEEQGLDIFLAAPTGRAAKRMTETTGMEARTIHRMLELNSALSEDDGRRLSFERNDENPLEADVVIIDETSMVDVRLFQALLKAIIPGTRLILVGDASQLPSVGPGQVLRDLLDSKCFPGVTLQKIYRQDEASDIVKNAHLINQGRAIRMDNQSEDFFVLERSEVNVIYKHVIQLIRDKLPGYVHCTPYDIQVLTPMRKGPLGCETLNPILQKYLNPADLTKKEHVSGENVYRVGDKVMQIRNNYQLEWEILGRFNVVVDKGMGVFNGDMGQIVEISDVSNQLTVEFDEGRRVNYPYSELDQLELSYAITIHKSQGSEYPAVILPLLGGPKMLFTRNLLYTAVTRAKNCVTILGRSKTIQEMIDNESEFKRYTALADRIRELDH